LTVEPGYEAAVAAALGTLADAVAVRSVADAVAAIQLLKSDEEGRATLLVGAAPLGDKAPRPPLPDGARWAVDVVRAAESIAGAVRDALDWVAIVPDLAAAQQLVTGRPQIRAVTTDGDVVASDHAYGGSASNPSVIEVQSAVDEAVERRTEAE